MSNNTKIFSEAIAEAKAIRETAMANAKLALEEAFAPRIQEMMSDKLEAMSQEEDEMKEDYGQGPSDAAMDAADEISLEELLAELEGIEEYGDEHAISTKSALGDDEEMMKENTIAEAEDDDEVGTITVKDLKDMFREVMADVMGGGEEEEAGEEEVEAGEEMEAGEDDLELEEILAEIANLEESDEKEMEEGIGSAIKGGLDKFEKWIGDTSYKLDKAGEKSKVVQAINKGVDKTVAAGQKVIPTGGWNAGSHLEETDELDEWGNGMAAGNFRGDDEGDIARWIKKAAAKAKMSVQAYLKSKGVASMNEEELEEWGNGMAAGNFRGDDEGDLARWIKKAAAKAKMSVQAYLKSKGITSMGEAEELQEAMSTIATLRSELNEVNLLNAKLLYVNKLFKAKNLNEAQKVKVINAFDRAETVREAKNVFDTLNESLNTEKAKSQIKESLSFASKSAGVSDRQPIMEGNDFVNRMQKLAGII
jgi:hypothetical protein